MARPIVMPFMGMYTVEGTVGTWLRPAGVHVEAGEPVAEINTDKATFEVISPEAGFLHPIAESGAEIAVETVLGFILAEGEAPPPGTLRKSGSVRDHRPDTNGILSESSISGPVEIRATPVARRLAAERKIDLSWVKGSGPGGRIVEADILSFAPESRGVSRNGADGPEATVRKRLPLTGIRRIIAERLRQSLSTNVSLTLTREIGAETLVRVRSNTAASRGGAKFPYDAFFIKLLALSLRENPELNARIENDTILYLEDIHIGFAVAASRSLLAPVVRNADKKSLAQTALDIRQLSDRAQGGMLFPEEMEGGTATISNLGNYGIDAFTPILNPPQSTILGIGRIMLRPTVINGAIVPSETCVLSLTFDHRVTDGVPAALLLDSIARRMNDEKLLLALAGE